MPTTSAAIQAILSTKKQFNLVTGNLTLTDQSPYTTSLTLTAPWTIKGLFKVIDPAGQTCYINAGYDLNVYTAPDISITNLTSPPYAITFAIPLATGGDVIFGTYQIFYKVQCIEDVGGANTTTYAELNGGTGESDALVQCYPSVTTESYEANCVYALIKSTDTTAYGAYQTLTRVHVLIPPPLSGQATQTASSQIITYSAGIPYTGTWSWRITSTITYAFPNSLYITVQITGSGTFNIVCDTNFCKLLCIVRKYYTEFFGTFGKVPTSQDARNWLLVETNFNMAYFNQVICGKSDSDVQKYIDAIYDISGISPDCDCGCDGETPTPIIPTNTINGQDGTDGTNGITPAFRVNGGFVQVSVDNSATWQNLYSLASVTGPTGPAGADGTNGAAVLYTDLTTTTTAGTGLETIKSYTVPANTLATNGSYLIVSAEGFTNTANTTLTKTLGVYFNGTQIGIVIFVGIGVGVAFDVTITRISNTTVRGLAHVRLLQNSITAGTVILDRYYGVTIAGLDLTTLTYAAALRADSDVAGDIESNFFTVTNYVE